MVFKHEDYKVTTADGLMGGKGVTTMFHWLNSDYALGHGRLFGINSLAPGDSIGYHQHKNEIEAYYILKGKAKLVDNGAEFIVGVGEGMLCENMGSHSIENIGDEQLDFIACIMFTEQKKPE